MKYQLKIAVMQSKTCYSVSRPVTYAGKSSAMMQVGSLDEA